MPLKTAFTRIISMSERTLFCSKGHMQTVKVQLETDPNKESDNIRILNKSYYCRECRQAVKLIQK
jgi:hypothetical protein